ncbi:MAG: hypothetical protein Q7P63_07835 [Verrucomicrobiota bacterium JB022]|nr:hypothetical protein [Verrucomicrobiota bacterium JB022]
MALISITLAAALSGSEIDIQIGSGQTLHIQFTGNTSGEIYLNQLSPGSGLAASMIISPAGGGWPASYNYWNGAAYQSGALFSAGSPDYEATVSGLAAGTYRIGAFGMGGNLTEYYRDDSGSTIYVFQSDTANGLYVEFSFEVY